MNLYGDFNIDLVIYDVDNNTMYFVDQTCTISLLLLINRPTCILYLGLTIIYISSIPINEDFIRNVIITDIRGQFFLC